MPDSYTRHECWITPFVPTRRSRFVDLCALAAGYGVIALKLYLIWRTFQ